MDRAGEGHQTETPACKCLRRTSAAAASTLQRVLGSPLRCALAQTSWPVLCVSPASTQTCQALVSGPYATYMHLDSSCTMLQHSHLRDRVIITASCMPKAKCCASDHHQRCAVQGRSPVILRRAQQHGCTMSCAAAHRGCSRQDTSCPCCLSPAHLQGDHGDRGSCLKHHLGSLRVSLDVELHDRACIASSDVLQRQCYSSQEQLCTERARWARCTEAVRYTQMSQSHAALLCVHQDTRCMAHTDC